MTNAIDKARKALNKYDEAVDNPEVTTVDEMAFEVARVYDALRDLLDSLEYEYAQGFETDYYEKWYVGKSFGHESNRPLDEGYTLIRRGLLPWEKVS